MGRNSILNRDFNIISLNMCCFKTYYVYYHIYMLHTIYMFLWYNHKPCPTAGTARIPCEVQPLHFLSHYLFRYPFRCLSHCPYHPFPTHLFKQKLMWKGLFVLPLRAYGDLNHLMPLPSVSFQPSMMALKNILCWKRSSTASSLSDSSLLSSSSFLSWNSNFNKEGMRGVHGLQLRCHLAPALRLPTLLYG